MKTSLDLEIAQLIQKLQKEVEEEGRESEEIPFGEADTAFSEKPHMENDDDSQNKSNRILIPDPHLHYDHPLKSSKKTVAKAVIFVKRLIRKCVRFLIVPVLDEQSGFNYSVKAEIDRLNQRIELQEQRIGELERYRKELS